MDPDTVATTPLPALSSSEHVDDCDLCEAARFTHWYHEDAVCWIADCEVCLVPMVVWRAHGTEPSESERSHMLDMLSETARIRFPDQSSNDISIDTNMRQIPEHWHAHARDRDWYAQRGQRPLSKYSGVGGERIERG